MAKQCKNLQFHSLHQILVRKHVSDVKICLINYAKLFSFLAAVNGTCHNLSTIYFDPQLFTSGYDIMRANPLHKMSYKRSAIENDILRECRFTSKTIKCQPNAYSIVIDSLHSYYEWLNHYITYEDFDENQNGVNRSIFSGVTSNANDENLLGLQTDLMSGSLIIMTHIICPVVNISRENAPRLKIDYANQLSIASEMRDDELEDLIEDFGMFYVNGATFGHEVIIRFTLDKRTAHFLKTKNLNLAKQATEAGLFFMSKVNHDTLSDLSPNQETAIDFLANVKTQIFSGSTFSVPQTEQQTISTLIEAAFNQLRIVSVELKRIENIFYQLKNNVSKLEKSWRKAERQLCFRLLPLNMSGMCSTLNHSKRTSKTLQVPEEKKISNWLPHSDNFMFPFLFVWTNRSTICIRASWNHW